MPVIHLFLTDQALRDAIAEQLRIASFGEVREGGDFAAALSAGDTSTIILDAAPEKDRKILREQGGRKRVFFIGETVNEKDGDTLFTETFAKPLRLGHLLARLHFYLHPSSRRRDQVTQFGPYTLEPQNRQLVSKEGGDVIRLTEKEVALLEYLGENEASVTREELLAAIWGYDARIDTHTLETHIYRLRRKLDPQGTGTSWLVNEDGSYRLARESTIS